MIETVPHHGGLGLKRFLARRLAKQVGQTMGSASQDRKTAREKMDAAGDRIACADGVRIEAGEVAGQSALIFTPEAPRPGTLLFFHGGGYIVGSAQGHKPFTSQLAKAFNMKVISANYRLAPEDVCPAAVEDCEAVLQAVREQETGPVIVSGDSAGGGVTLAAVLRHRDAGRALPNALYLISPWVDLTVSGESAVTQARHDPMLTVQGIIAAGHMYADSLDPTSPDASPLYAQLKGLPPVFIQVGEHEILRDDTVRLAARLEEAGVVHHAQIWQAMFHDFQLFGPIISEGRAAIKAARDWIEPHL